MHAQLTHRAISSYLQCAPKLMVTGSALYQTAVTVKHAMHGRGSVRDRGSNNIGKFRVDQTRTLPAVRSWWSYRDYGCVRGNPGGRVVPQEQAQPTLLNARCRSPDTVQSATIIRFYVITYDITRSSMATSVYKTERLSLSHVYVLSLQMWKLAKKRF